MCKFKRYLCEFSGVDDVTYIFVFNENISHSGLSGQIIYINHSEIEDLFSQNIEDTTTINNFISLLCHEMSHRFDFDTDFKSTFEYCFDKEFLLYSDRYMPYLPVVTKLVMIISEIKNTCLIIYTIIRTF